MMTTADRRVYVRGVRLPFEEDETHEFKGHRNISAEDIPPWTRRATADFRCSRKAVSRNLNAFLNTGRGGTVYLGVDDVGRVLGMHLTRFQRDHVRLSVRDTLRRYQPPVPDGRCRVTFVPVVHAGDGAGAGPHQAFKYDAGQRRQQHRVATHEYCWCDADAKARSQMGHIPTEYVIEVEVRPWDEPAQLHPFHLSEVGSCHIRRQASIQQLTAADVVQLTRHQAAALYERRADQEARLTSRLGAALLRRLDTDHLRLARPPAAGQWCRCGTTCRAPPAPPPADWDGDAPSSAGDSGTGTCCSLLDSVGRQIRSAADTCPATTGEVRDGGGADRTACDSSPTADTSHAVPAATAIDARADSRSSPSVCAPNKMRAWTSRPADLRAGSPAAVGTVRCGSVVRLASGEADPVCVPEDGDGGSRLARGPQSGRERPTRHGPLMDLVSSESDCAGPAAALPQRLVGPAATCSAVPSGDDLVGSRVDSMWSLAGGRSESARPAVDACSIHRMADCTEEVGTGVLESEEIGTEVLDSQEVGERLLDSSENSSEPESEDSWDASYRPPMSAMSERSDNRPAQECALSTGCLSVNGTPYPL